MHEHRKKTRGGAPVAVLTKRASSFSCGVVKAPLKDTSGQASVEYAIVLVGFLALVIALGAISSFLGDGELISHTLQNSSHAVENIDFDNIKDFVCV